MAKKAERKGDGKDEGAGAAKAAKKAEQKKAERKKAERKKGDGRKGDGRKGDGKKAEKVLKAEREKAAKKAEEKAAKKAAKAAKAEAEAASQAALAAAEERVAEEPAPGEPIADVEAAGEGPERETEPAAEVSAVTRLHIVTEPHPDDAPAEPRQPLPRGDVASVRAALRLSGGPVDLDAIDPRATPNFPGNKDEALADIAAMGPQLAELQERLYAQAVAGGARRRLLVVVQGMDTSGKGGTVKHVIGQFNPSGCHIHAFKAPTAQELAHPFLWRIKEQVPGPGLIGVFDRSHYEDVLIARVRNLVPRGVWARRYATINRFEQGLAKDDVTVVKLFLHISPDEQKERLLARLDNPDKHWKFNPADIDERSVWSDYRRAYEVALEKCDGDAAPWYVVPSDRKWYRNWAISRLLLEHLAELDPRYPAADFDVAAERERLLDT
jgi:PPK2 family polyphosphate:nucleotide phosphotransferase